MRIAFISVPLGLTLTAGFIATGFSVVWSLLLASLLCSVFVLLIGFLTSLGRADLSISNQSWSDQHAQERENAKGEQASVESSIG